MSHGSKSLWGFTWYQDMAGGTVQSGREYMGCKSEGVQSGELGGHMVLSAGELVVLRVGERARVLPIRGSAADPTAICSAPPGSYS